MKKKKWLNSKIIFTITMVLVGCYFMSTNLWAQYPPSYGDCYYLYITRVVVADLNNPSLREYPICYSDFTHLTAHLTQGKTYSVSLENSMSWNPIYWKIWIDYNGDEDFDDACEEVFSGFGGTIVTGSISVPCCTITGDTRMRVALGTYDSLPSSGFIGNGEVEDYTVNITSKPDLKGNVGNTEVFPSTSTSANLRAMPFTMPENGIIESVTMYHNGGGGGNMMLCVFDGEGLPQNLLAYTPPTSVSATSGWQTIGLTSSVYVPCGNTIWLAWCYESNPGIRYQTGSPGRADAGESSCADPGSWTTASYIYSIYATYTKPECTVGYTDVFSSISTSNNLRAMPFTMPENGIIESVTMYHNGGGGGNMMLCVFDGEGLPQNLLANTPITSVSTTSGWQTIDLTSPVYVPCGNTIWLAWCYSSNPGIRYKIGSPGRADAGESGCANPGSWTTAPYIYSIYATYIYY